MDSSRDRFGDDFGGERMWGLKELPLPESPPWWPVAPGWYFVAGFVLLLLAYLVWRQYRAWRRNQYRRDALAQLSRMTPDPGEAKKLPFLLRRTALLAYPRVQVASLRGREWMSWLNGSAGSDIFVAEDADTLDKLAYAPDRALPAADQVARAIAAARRWTRLHRAGL